MHIFIFYTINVFSNYYIKNFNSIYAIVSYNIGKI